MTPTGIDPLPIQQWTNKHQNFTHSLVPDASFKLWNPPAAQNRDRYLATTKNFQWLIEHAITHNLEATRHRQWVVLYQGRRDRGGIDRYRRAELFFSRFTELCESPLCPRSRRPLFRTVRDYYP